MELSEAVEYVLGYENLGPEQPDPAGAGGGAPEVPAPEVLPGLCFFADL